MLGEIRIIRYLISGGTATFTDLVLLFLLTNVAHIWYLTSSVLALVGGFAVSFVLQKFWTFRSHSMRGVHLQLSMHVSLSLLNIVINTVLMYVFVQFVFLPYLVAQFLAAGLLACANFFIYRRYIFPQQ